MSKNLTDHERYVLSSLTNFVRPSFRTWMQQIILWFIVLAASFGLFQKVYNPGLYEQYIGVFKFLDISAVFVQYATTVLVGVCYVIALGVVYAVCPKANPTPDEQKRYRTAEYLYMYYNTFKGFAKKPVVPLHLISYAVMATYFVALIVANHPYFAVAQIALIWFFKWSMNVKHGIQMKLVRHATPEVWGQIQQLIDAGAFATAASAKKYDTEHNSINNNVILTRAGVGGS